MENNFSLQHFLQSCGKTGCYYLCLVKIATDMGKNLNEIIAATVGMINDNSMFYDFKDRDDPNNFFINDAAKCFTWLTGKKCVVSARGTLEKANYPDYVIECLETTNGANTSTHFRMKNFDPNPNSNASKYGVLKSYRCFYLCDK